MSKADPTVEIAATAAASSNNQSPPHGVSSSSSSSSWLLPALVDVEERMKKLVLVSNSEQQNAGDTFAERAEWYYQKRPQLLNLLKDLYNGYITLLYRCRKHKHHSEVAASSADAYADAESNAESNVSYQQHTATATTMATAGSTDIDELVAELVAKNIENDILLSRVDEMDKVGNESMKKIELLKNLMELLESERIVLVSENVKLGYKVSAVMEENKGLASEAMFMKRTASELAKCVLRMREDHRVFMLGEKIEDLQEQIYGLEKRNKEYYQMLVKKEQEVKQYETRSKSRRSVKESTAKVLLESCFFQFDEKIKLRRTNSVSKKKGSSSKWWERVKKADFFNCMLHSSCS